jgi:hypothetical protein
MAFHCGVSSPDGYGFDAGQFLGGPDATASPPLRVPAETRAAMLAALPSLRAFAISLTRDRDYADDLVQDTILRAWKNIDRFEVGTNLNAWLFTILRNAFLSQYRKTRREVEDPDGSFAARLRAPPEQPATCDVQDMPAWCTDHGCGRTDPYPVRVRRCGRTPGVPGPAYD